MPVLFPLACRTSVSTLPGTELHAVIEDLVREIQYDSGDRPIVLTRASRSNGFTVLVYGADGAIVDSCPADAVGVDRTLKSLCSVHVVRELSAREARALRDSPKGSLDILEIHLSVPESEPLMWLVLPHLDDRTPVAVSQAPDGWEVDVPKDVLVMLRGGCGTLGSQRPGGAR